MNFIICGFVAFWFLCLFLLHFLKSDFTPYNHTCSEYANGQFGFIMNIAFFALAITNILLAIKFIKQNNIFMGVLFCIIAVGFIGLGIFKADITISTDKETTQGRIHLLFGFIAMFTINIATFVLASKNIDIVLWLFASVCVASFVLFIITMNIKAPVFFGISQRIFMAIFTAWFFYVAFNLQNLLK
jgi:hypothetical protein